MTRGPQCRYTSKHQRCGNEAVDPVGEVLLCQHHLALTIELLAAHGYTVMLPKSSRPRSGARS
jgi:hypothetical protein